MEHRRGRPRWLRTVWWGAVAVVLAGCELGVTAAVDVDRDGGGTVAVTLAADRALLAELDALAVDPTAELEAAVTTAGAGWRVRRETADGGLAVTVTRDVASAAELTETLRELAAGLSAEDPALVADLELDVADDGAAQLAGTAGLRPPAGPGVLGDPDLPDATAMGQLTEDAVVATLAVTLPGEVTDHDADAVDGRTLRWRLPVGDERTVSATAAAPSGPPPEVVLAAAGGTLLVAGAALLWVLVRRRRRRHGTEEAR